jgi:hypothetical protein
LRLSSIEFSSTRIVPKVAKPKFSNKPQHEHAHDHVNVHVDVHVLVDMIGFFHGTG